MKTVRSGFACPTCDSGLVLKKRGTYRYKNVYECPTCKKEFTSGDKVRLVIKED